MGVHFGYIAFFLIKINLLFMTLNVNQIKKKNPN